MKDLTLREYFGKTNVKKVLSLYNEIKEDVERVATAEWALKPHTTTPEGLPIPEARKWPESGRHAFIKQILP